VCIYVSSKSSVERENEKEKQKAKEKKKEVRSIMRAYSIFKKMSKRTLYLRNMNRSI
jgi:hypothetical protein